MNKHWWVGLAAIVLVGCGGSTGSGTGGVTCGWNGACGGDNVGSWKVESLCILGTPTAPASCPAATVHESGQVSGTLDYAADGTYVERCRRDAHRHLQQRQHHDDELLRPGQYVLALRPDASQRRHARRAGRLAPVSDPFEPARICFVGMAFDTLRVRMRCARVGDCAGFPEDGHA